MPVLGLDSRVEDWQTKDQARELMQRFVGLQYVDPRPPGSMLRLSLGHDAIPQKAPERGSFNLGNNDLPLRRAIDTAHDAGLQVFLSCLGWKQAGLAVPELMVTYIDGQPLAKIAEPAYVYENRPPLCPNRPEVQRWKESLAASILSAYEVDGLTLRYSNFNQPGFYTELFSCWCDHCAKAAADGGYRFEEMRTAMRKTLDGIRRLDKPALLRIAQSGSGFIGLFCQLADSPAPARWFDFRADSVMNAIRRIRKVTESSARRKGALFGAMTYYPTFALIVGHRYSDFAGAVSYIVPQLLHWQVLYMQNFMALAEWFRSNVKGLSEAEALTAVYGLFDNDGFPMPRSYAEMPLDPDKVDGPRSDHPALVPIIAAEMRRVRAWAPELECHPILKATEWPKAATGRLTELAMTLGAKAVWYQ